MRKITLLGLLLVMTLIISDLKLSAQVVISQVYGGGGNSGSTYKNDYIELYNRGNSPVSLNGWSVQYASATGSTTAWTTQNSTVLPDITLNSGQYYLIQESAGSGGTVNLPTPDCIGTLALSGTAGKVALCNSTTPLTSTDFNGSQPIGASIVDFVGFGATANCYEGTAATPAPSNTTAIFRAKGGLTDTNNNGADFTTGAPNPRNSSNSQATTASEAPTFSIQSGNYLTNQDIIITSGTTGAKIYYTVDGTIPDNTKNQYTNPVTISTTTTLKAIAYDSNNQNPSSITSATYTFVTEVSSIQDLYTPGFYKLKTEAILTFKSSTRNQKFFQNNTGGLWIDDSAGKLPNTYNVGDGVTGLVGTTSLYNGMIQFVPFSSPGSASSTGNTVTPKEISITDMINYPAQLVKVKAVKIDSTGTYAASKNYVLNNNINTVLRTQYSDVDYIGAEIKTGQYMDIVGFVIIYNTTAELIPRSLTDFQISTDTKSIFKYEPSISTFGNRLSIVDSQTNTIEIFNTLGVKVKIVELVNGSAELNLSKGIYIVRAGNKTAKIRL